MVARFWNSLENYEYKKGEIYCPSYFPRFFVLIPVFGSFVALIYLIVIFIRVINVKKLIEKLEEKFKKFLNEKY